MFIYCIPAFVRKSIVSAAVSASLTSLALFHAVEDAAAREMTRCQVKYSICSQNCIMKANDVGADSMSRGAACLQRTCNHQFSACARDSGESQDPYHDQKGMTGPKGARGGKGGTRRIATPVPTRTISPHSVVTGGILGDGGILQRQGPAATGAPASAGAPAAPSAPPVIIR